MEAMGQLLLCGDFANGAWIIVITRCIVVFYGGLWWFMVVYGGLWWIIHYKLCWCIRAGLHDSASGVLRMLIADLVLHSDKFAHAVAKEEL